MKHRHGLDRGEHGFHPSAVGHRRAAAAVLDALSQDRAEWRAYAA